MDDFDIELVLENDVEKVKDRISSMFEQFRDNIKKTVMNEIEENYKHDMVHLYNLGYEASALSHAFERYEIDKRDRAIYSLEDVVICGRCKHCVDYECSKGIIKPRKGCNAIDFFGYCSEGERE